MKLTAPELKTFYAKPEASRATITEVNNSQRLRLANYIRDKTQRQNYMNKSYKFGSR